MKEYRLASWPELRPPYQSTAHRRIVSGMSHRHMTLAQLVDTSGLRKIEVEHFIDTLAARGHIDEREQAPAPLFGSLRPFFGWLRRSWHASIGSD